MPVWLIGIVFSMDTITYTLTSFFLNFIKEANKNFQKLVCLGVFFFIVSLMLSGPAPNILPNEVYVICIGILFGGVGGALVNNNCVPALSTILENNVKDLDLNQIKNNVSAINTGAFGLGSILGPILASLLESSIGYRWSFTLIGIFVAFIAVNQYYATFFYK